MSTSTATRPPQAGTSPLNNRPRSSPPAFCRQGLRFFSLSPGRRRRRHNHEPDASQIAEITLLAAEQIRRFGITPRAALVSHSNFGSSGFDSADKMRQALALIQERAPDLMVEGEMQADSALSTGVRGRILPDSLLEGEANLLIMPNLDAANIAFSALKVLGNGVSVGPILLGAAQPVHVLNRTVTARGIANMSAFAVVEAQADRSGVDGD